MNHGDFRYLKHKNRSPFSSHVQAVFRIVRAEVTVISFGFKKRRFAELHRAALRFPASRRSPLCENRADRLDGLKFAGMMLI